MPRPWLSLHVRFRHETEAQILGQRIVRVTMLELVLQLPILIQSVKCLPELVAGLADRLWDALPAGQASEGMRAAEGSLRLTVKNRPRSPFDGFADQTISTNRTMEARMIMQKIDLSALEYFLTADLWPPRIFV